MQIDSEVPEHTFTIRSTLYYFPKRSLQLFNNDNPFRIKMVELATSPDFDNFILLVILVNSLIMASKDYTNPYDYSNPGNFLEENLEFVFKYIFILEAIVKIIAFGLVIEPNSQLRDPFYCLDFFVVITSLITLEGQNTSVLRSMRLFKPLRNLNAIPSMRKLLSTIVDSMSSLLNIFGLMIFFYIIFGILSVNLWKGTAHQKCRLTPVPIDGFWPVLQNYAHLCGGSNTCPGEGFDT